VTRQRSQRGGKSPGFIETGDLDNEFGHVTPNQLL
jgi:hypothetical protein